MEAGERAGIAVARNTLDALLGTLDPGVVANPEVLTVSRSVGSRS